MRATPRLPAQLLALILLVFTALPLAGGCRPQAAAASFDGSLAEEHAARLETWLRKHPEDHRARLELAHTYWLHLAAPERAVGHLDTLTALDEPPALARFARATIAQTHGDLDRAAAELAKLLLEAPEHERAAQRELALALTPVAARSLEQLIGTRPGDEDELIALFEQLELERYPGETSEVLLSLRAQIARHRGEPYRDFYARQGCVQSWRVGVVEGYRGALELTRLGGGRDVQVDPEAQATPLSCAVRVWNPEPRSGIRRLRTTVEVKEPSFRLTVQAQNESRLYVDGQLLWASDRSDRYPVEKPTFVVPAGPGRHEVELRTAIPGERAWVLVRATDMSGRPLSADPDAEATGSWTPPTASEASPDVGADGLLERRAWGSDALRLPSVVYDPLWSFLALGDALAQGDSDRAELLAGELREHSEGFAEGHLALAEFERRDPSRGRTSSAARQQAELEAALDLDPTLLQARLALLSMRLDRGEEAEVIEELEGLAEAGLEPTGAGSLGLSMLRYRAYRLRGSDAQAERALEAAAAVHPGSCDVILARRTLARERKQVRVEEQLAEALDTCPSSVAISARLAAERQRFDEAEALLLRQLELIPDNIDAMDELAAIAVARGRFDEAARWHHEMLALAPYRALSHIELADLEARGGDGRSAREALLAAIDRFPHNGRLREIGERIGIPDELMAWRIDGAEALASYRGDVEKGLAAEGVDEVLLLDREVSILYSDGSHRHIVHQMFHVLSDRSIDAHGEFDGGNARLLTLHSIKPDGSIVEPESIPGKEGLSLRGLEIGDVVEIEFVMESSPEPALPGHVDLGRFRFQSPEVPFHRSELIVVLPRELEPKIDIEARNHPPKPTRRELTLREGPFVELSFVAHQVPRLGSEPGSRSSLDELPMVKVHVPLKIEDWLDQLAAELRASQRTNPELRALARSLTEDYDTREEKVDALWSWVVDAVEEAGDLSTPATLTLSARQGSRLMLLRAMLQTVGIDSQLWLLRDRFGPTIREGGDPLVETYDTAMLAVPRGGGRDPLVFGTSSEVVPLGYLSPSYAGGRAVRIQLEGDEPPPGYVDVPQNPERYRDLRRWDIEVAIAADGHARIRGTIELRGLEAIYWRDAFDKVDSDRLPEIFTQAELSRILPGGALDLESLEFVDQWQIDEPLIIRFAARARTAGVVQGGQLGLLAAAVPIDLVTGFARLPRRWSGMVIPYAPVLEAKVRYELEEGRRFVEVPARVDIETSRGSYERSIVSGGEGESVLELSSRATLTPGIVEAEDYDEFLSFAREVQGAEQALIRAH